MIGSLRTLVRILSGPLTFGLLYAIVPVDGSPACVLAVMGWMLVWWALQVVPIGITALLPIVLFPALGIDSIRQVTAHYANPVIYLFLGGFILGLSIEKWNLHKRLALIILKYSGQRPSQIVSGFMLATALLSMWISNTAAAMMMLPIGISVINLVGPQLDSEAMHKRFSLSLLLGLAFSANIGGMATLIGTPPNLVLAALAKETLQTELSFAGWMLFAMPLSAVLFMLVLLVNTKLMFRLPANKLSGLRSKAEADLEALGKPVFGERMAAGVFACTATLWILRAPLSKIQGLGFLDDTVIAIIAAIMLFVLPGNNGAPLLEWKDTKRLPWEILLLFGGGISLAAGLERSGVVSIFGESLGHLQELHILVILLAITTLAIFLTEGMSNVALVSVFAPLAISLAPSFGVSGLELAVPLTLAASCAFMLPIATPPNAIVFGSGLIDVRHMMRSGLVLNLVSTLIIALYAYFLVPLCF